MMHKAPRGRPGSSCSSRREEKQATDFTDAIICRICAICGWFVTQMHISKLVPVCLLILCCIRIALPFQNGGAVLGRILEAENNSPVPHATVIARNQKTGYQNTVLTAPDGTFFVTSLPPGLYAILAACAGFQQGSISGYPVGLSGTPGAEPAEMRLARSAAPRSQSESSVPAPQPARLRSIQAESELVVEAMIRWNAAPGINASKDVPAAQSPGGGAFSVVESRQARGPLPRQRMPELSKDQILIVILNEQEEQKGWLLIPDPRILRTEGPGPNGELTGEVFYQSSAEFLVPLSGDLLPATIKIYKPYWTGEAFSLDLLGAVALQ